MGVKLDDPARLEALALSGMLDTPPEEEFDRLTRLAARLLHAPVSLVSLVDDRRQFFKSIAGTLPEPWGTARQTPLSHSFCKHVVADAAPLVVEDARANAKVAGNLAIRDLGVVAYLGVPLATSVGKPLGSFCVIDGEPRHWSHEEMELMRELAEAVVGRIELRMLAKVMHTNYVELRKLELQRDELVQMLVHDLRAPMSSYLLGLDVVAAADVLSAEYRSVLRAAIDGGEKLVGMVGDILDVSKAESGKLTLERSDCAPAELARAALEQLATQAERRNVGVELRAAPDLPTLSVDREKIRRVLVNLIANAIQHTPAQGRVVVEVGRRAPGSVDFSVSDNGSGIPADALGRVFEKFGQSATRKYHGTSTGLGLPFARMAIEAHGGRIEVDSELGRGTRFTFNLPVR